MEKEKSKNELKEELDTLETQLFRMQNNIKEIAKSSEIISIDQARNDNWVVIYVNRDQEMFQLMLHDCRKPFRGTWDSAIQVEYKDESTLHIADIKGEKNQGYGSVLMNHLKEVARDENVQFITGDIAKRDVDHFDRLEYFYKKHYFNVNIDHKEKCGDVTWNDE
ncbi:uL29 family ribosomal protein [Oceanobacillus senegalensis]|uniref:uL29 family ribosomal protein n=1 Tax=Oceanobacillus senegalensis TaxID=1936063 RepID=UPI003184053D